MCLLLEKPSEDYTDPIYEFNMRQIQQAVKDTDPGRIDKAKPLKSYYLGINKRGNLMFRTTSGTIPGAFWYQEIKLLDLKRALDLFSKDEQIRNKDIVNLAIYGDLALYCNDLSFRYYGWQYMAWTLGYGLKKEVRFPNKRNPRLKGAICKHLYNVLSVLPFHINVIVRDLRKRHFIPDTNKDKGKDRDDKK